MAHPVSVLVDGDNISAKFATDVLTIAARHGALRVVRVYADAQKSCDWHRAVGYRMIHSGTGKNATDILLALDAMELMLVEDMRIFVIVSSDGDFSHLATRLKELGATVIGVGEAKAPCAFRACCTEFVEIGPPNPCSAKPGETQRPTPLDAQIRAVIATHSQQGKGIRIAELGAYMFKQHGVRISSQTERNWRGYLIARPTLYDVGPRGPDAIVRFLPGGF